MATNIEFSIREDGYFRRDEQFRITNTVHGFIFGLKEQWKTAVKYQYDVFLCLGPAIIRTNQIQKDGSISQGTYWLVKSDQMYSIKRFWFSLNFLAGIGW
jgi:hypothetical protein